MARLMACTGTVEKVDGVIHLIASRVFELNDWLAGLTVRPQETPAAFLEKGRFFH